MMKDKVESARVRRLVRARPKQCFRNAVHVVRYVPGYEEADYVEGVIVPANHVVTEHGWVEKNGVIVDPITLGPEDTVKRARQIMHDFNISGVPIVEAGKLVGILTKRDLTFHPHEGGRIADVMTHDHLVTAPGGTTLEEAKKIMHRNKV